MMLRKVSKHGFSFDDPFVDNNNYKNSVEL